MTKFLSIPFMALLLCACEPARNTPAQQTADFKVCADAGMGTYQTGYGEIKCAPPRSKAGAGL